MSAGTGRSLGCRPPTAFGPDLLRRSIAHRIQKKAYGGLSRSAQRLLDQMMKAFAKPSGKIVLPRRIKPGSVEDKGSGTSLIQDFKIGE